MHDNTTNTGTDQGIAQVLEKYFTAKQVADQLALCEQTVIRMFQDEKGVLKLRKGLRGKRDYVTLRIPESVLKRVIEARSR